MKDSIKEIIDTCDKELSDIATMIAALKPLDKTAKYLTKYALIKASGTIEYSFRNIVADYFDESNLPQVPTFIEAKVRKGSMSGTYDNMSGLLKSFDNTWSSDFKSKVADLDDSERIKQSAASLVQNRHSFAHGKEPTATFNDICNYYKDAKILVSILDDVIITK